MSQLRLNPLTGRWVTIVAERAMRPTDFATRTPTVESDPSRPCPFCPGSDEISLPPIDSTGDEDDWRMRVLPNLYPAFAGEDSLAVRNLGPVHVMTWTLVILLTLGAYAFKVTGLVFLGGR